MPRPSSETLTGREAQIMDVLWRVGEATADALRAELPDSLHDSTVRTLLRILTSKGYLTHEVVGKAFVYRPAIERAKAQRLALGELLGRFFVGSAESLVLRLIEDERLSTDQLDEIRRSAVPSLPKRRRKPGDQS